MGLAALIKQWFYGSPAPKKPSATAQKSVVSGYAKAIVTEPMMTSKKLEVASGEPKPITLRPKGPPLPVAENPAELAFAEWAVGLTADCDRAMRDPGFDLPVMPSTSLRLLDLLSSPYSSVTQISKTLQSDPVLTTKFLKLANSAYFATRQEIKTVQGAVTVLGLRQVRMVVLSVSLHGVIFKDPSTRQFAQHIWQHAIECAVTAQLLASRTRAVPESCYLAGLLHDIGKLPALLLLQRSMKKNEQLRPHFLASVVERHHEAFGGALARIWKLPQDARVATAGHHAIQTLDDARSWIRNEALLTSSEQLGSARLKNLDDELIPAYDLDSLTRTLGTVVLADRSLVALGRTDEPGDVDVLDAQLSLDLGLDYPQLFSFLQALPGHLDSMPKL